MRWRSRALQGGIGGVLRIGSGGQLIEIGEAGRVRVAVGEVRIRLIGLHEVAFEIEQRQ